MMKLKQLFRLLAVSALCGSPLLLAQSTKQVTVNASIAETLSLTVDATSVALAFAAADYDVTTGLATKTAVRATTFSVSANRAWKLTVRPGDQYFTFTPVGTATDPRKPVSALAVRTGTTAYASFSGITDIAVSTGTAGGYSKTGNVIPVDYQMGSSLATDPPGAYLLTLTYTLAAQ